MTDRPKLTRQGVRDLSTGGVNGHRTRKCRHFWGPIEVVDLEWALDPDNFQYYRREIWGRHCLHCSEITT